MSGDGIEDRRSPLAKALGGKVAWKRVTVERGRLAGVDIAVRSLPQDRIQSAMRAAVQYLTEKCGWREEQLYTELGEATHDAETQLQVLARALITPPRDDHASLTEGTAVALVHDAEDLRTLLDPPEVAYLFREFTRFQQERSPFTRAQTPEEIEALVDSLGKGLTPPSRILSFDDATLRNIAHGLALRLRRLMNSPSSPSSPSTDTSDGSSVPSDSETTTGMTIEVQPTP